MQCAVLPLNLWMITSLATRVGAELSAPTKSKTMSVKR
jgi:hypothetical protein